MKMDGCVLNTEEPRGINKLVFLGDIESVQLITLITLTNCFSSYPLSYSFYII